MHEIVYSPVSHEKFRGEKITGMELSFSCMEISFLFMKMSLLIHAWKFHIFMHEN